MEEVRWMPIEELDDRIQNDPEFRHCLNPVEVRFLKDMCLMPGEEFT